jgi:hypothetical protein
VRGSFAVEHIGAGDAVLHGEVTTVIERRDAEQRAQRGCDIDELGAVLDDPERPHALAAEDERRPGLHEPERTVLAEVAPLVLPVVGSRVQNAEVGRGRRVEELRDLFERMGIGVVDPGRVRIRTLFGKGRELVGRLIRERIPALDRDSLEPVTTAAEPDPPVGGEGFVDIVTVGEHHVDDRLQLGVEKNVEGSLDNGADCVFDLMGRHTGRL